jgi:hypothetical protein
MRKRRAQPVRDEIREFAVFAVCPAEQPNVTFSNRLTTIFAGMRWPRSQISRPISFISWPHSGQTRLQATK